MSTRDLPYEAELTDEVILVRLGFVHCGLEDGFAPSDVGFRVTFTSPQMVAVSLARFDVPPTQAEALHHAEEHRWVAVFRSGRKIYTYQKQRRYAYTEVPPAEHVSLGKIVIRLGTTAWAGWYKEAGLRGQPRPVIPSAFDQVGDA